LTPFSDPFLQDTKWIGLRGSGQSTKLAGLNSTLLALKASQSESFGDWLHFGTSVAVIPLGPEVMAIYGLSEVTGLNNYLFNEIDNISTKFYNDANVSIGRWYFYSQHGR